MSPLESVLGLLLVAAGLVAHGERRARRQAEARVGRAGEELERLQRAFSRFAPATIVEEIIAKGVSTGAEKKEVTILFADLKGFTAMGDTLDPAVLVEIMNDYFREMSAAIASNNGHVSKFIGDGILALFGALEPNPWQANDAVEAALAMCARLDAYNERLVAAGRPRLSIGIGIHCGPVVAGVAGSEELREFTVFGRHVNLASRVEGLTRQHETEVLVTADVRRQLAPRFTVRELPAVAVKGIAEPVVTFAVVRPGA